ncbi:MAG: extracellular solute-binding protein [Candidatus Liptonbacteria bacterium]|nr:extracellular solute-binding protein [Candidatus Liptonbacteria bacterium]
MKLSQKQIFILAGIAVVFILIFVVVGLNVRRDSGVREQVSLNFWGTESSAAIEKVIQSYKAFRPNVQVTYKEIDPAKYDGVLVDALAEGAGPDVLYVRNRALPKHMNKLYPILPAQLGLAGFRNFFPAVAEQDFVSASGSPATGEAKQIFALPLYVDTMATIYNKDLFNQAAIVFPPKTWDEFLSIVPRLKTLNESGQIVRAAAAIGGSEQSVDAGVDLLVLLMLQNGTQMTTNNFSSATFASARDDNKNPGLAAFNFYLQFANAGSPRYTWNDAQQNSIDSFANGKTAIVFNYKSAIDKIGGKSPFLNVAVAPMLQPTGSETGVNYPRYWGLAVSKQSKSIGWAWDFALFATTNPDASKLYLDATGHPPALRSLIAQKLDDPDMGVFVRQALTAQSWHEADDEIIDRIINDAITRVLSGKADSEHALRQAQDQASQLMTSK